MTADDIRAELDGRKATLAAGPRTVAELAKVAGIPHGTIKPMMSGARPLSDAVVAKVRAVLWPRSLSHLNVSIRTSRVLRDARVETVADLASLTESQFLQLRGGCRRTLREAKALLEGEGVGFRPAASSS